jgi:hypothetical protein
MTSHQQKIEFIKPLLWDTKITPEEAVEVLDGKQINGLTKTNLYTKMLVGYKWYEVLNIVGKDKINELLADEVIKGLFPRAKRDRFFNVRKILYK